MNSGVDFISNFRNHVERNGTKTALKFLDLVDGQVVESSLNYSELDERARAVAVALRARLERGDRVLLLYPPGIEFVVGFIGALMAGIIAVPAPVPDGRTTDHERLIGIARDAGVKAVLTSSAFAEIVQFGVSDLPSAPLVLATDTVSVEDAERWVPVEIDGQTVALVQYTSGSTSEPKGVIVTHANLSENQREIGAAICSNEETIGCGWLPHFHDMGLIGLILHPLWCGASVVLMSPLTFLRRPQLWLEALHKYRATITLAPNFALAYVARRVKAETIVQLDLSSVDTVLTGSEPVQADSIRGFVDLLSPCGLKPQAVMPVYGLAEATLFVTGASAEAGPVEYKVSGRLLARNMIEETTDASDMHCLVSSGRPQKMEVAIVDLDSETEQPRGRVGEIWLHGSSIARGYWNKPTETAGTFDGHLRGHGGWLRTGDFGAMLDGQLFVTGRIKDMIIINGRNIYAHDIELTARRASPATAAGVGSAFGVGRPERLVLVQEIDLKLLPQDESIASLTGSIHAILGRECSVRLSKLILVPKGTVARTSSGKIRRAHMRELYESGKIASIEPSKSSSD
ncbi:fatty acyl-AMP ligase [Nocardia sp. AB354]|uniref:fatty acyl-AMP ligase n=1 Tax=Nocardia sp. AB354 TaxID=3413283 RepID=UPI003C14F1EF